MSWDSLAVNAATIRGVEAFRVSCEVSCGGGIPGISIVGLPDGSVLEARTRVRCAIRNCGFELPRLHITVNLAPAELRKTGTGFDLPLAVGILAATGQIPRGGLDDLLFVGELGLDGSVNESRGMVAYRHLADSLGLRLVCAPESPVGPDPQRTLGLSNLSQLRGGALRIPTLDAPVVSSVPPASPELLDYRDVVDQEMAKRALVIAAAGDHGLLMVGPPGSGKSMLAQRMTSILPPLHNSEREEALLVHSVAEEDIGGLLAGRRPFRSPHHSISCAGMIGGGRPVVPGEVSLAHGGVLFLDEIPEFASNVLQALRQPFEEHEVRLVRADGLYRFPCRFSFLAAANPCPCGHLGDIGRECRCSPAQIEKYQSRVGGPLLDRIDMHIFVSRPDSRLVVRDEQGTGSDEMREKVISAREYAAWRRGREPSEGRPTVSSLSLGADARRSLEAISRQLGLGGRATVKVASVARTIADLDHRARVSREDVGEACAYRERSR